MNNSAYSALFAAYDKLNSETDYSSWADFIVKIFEKYGNNVSSVLDMGCGTGAMTFQLYDRGYDMIALDISEEMLSVAHNTASEKNISGILWLCQDMSRFELYGTVNAVVCCLDGMNHLTDKKDFERCVHLVHNYLDPDGLFVFDVNTPHKFESFYGQNDYILEDENVMCCWQNDYDKDKEICDFYLTVFEKTDKGLWKRTDTDQKERCYQRDYIEKVLSDNGMELCGIFGDFQFNAPENDCDRWYITAKVSDK